MNDFNLLPALILLVGMIFSAVTIADRNRASGKYFTGKTKEFLLHNFVVAGMQIYGSYILTTTQFSYYNSYTGKVVQENGIVLLVVILIILSSIPVYFLNALARLKYLKISNWFIILMCIAFINIVFIIVLSFMKPKHSTGDNDNFVKNISTNITSKISETIAINKKDNSVDKEIKDLKKKIEIAELKKKLKDLEEEL